MAIDYFFGVRIVLGAAFSFSVQRSLYSFQHSTDSTPCGHLAPNKADQGPNPLNNIFNRPSIPFTEKPLEKGTLASDIGRPTQARPRFRELFHLKRSLQPGPKMNRTDEDNAERKSEGKESNANGGETYHRPFLGLNPEHEEGESLADPQYSSEVSSVSSGGGQEAKTPSIADIQDSYDAMEAILRHNHRALSDLARSTLPRFTGIDDSLVSGRGCRYCGGGAGGCPTGVLCPVCEYVATNVADLSHRSMPLTSSSSEDKDTQSFQ